MAFVFIHSSIKTRIETQQIHQCGLTRSVFLYIVPLKQGLKHIPVESEIMDIPVFIHSSIKTRIETEPENAEPIIGSRGFYT